MKKVSNQERHLIRTYGISEEQYQSLLSKQDGKCSVCERNADEFPTRLAVDHNHKTGEIRGLLCRYCNHRLVGRHTDAALVARIARYLEQSTGWFVPVRKRKRRRSGKTTPRTKRSST